MVADCGQLPSLKWLHKAGYQFNPSLYYRVITSGRIDILEFLLDEVKLEWNERYSTYLPSEEVLSFLTKRGLPISRTLGLNNVSFGRKD